MYPFSSKAHFSPYELFAATMYHQQQQVPFYSDVRSELFSAGHSIFEYKNFSFIGRMSSYNFSVVNQDKKSKIDFRVSILFHSHAVASLSSSLKKSPPFEDKLIDILHDHRPRYHIHSDCPWKSSDFNDYFLPLVQEYREAYDEAIPQRFTSHMDSRHHAMAHMKSIDIPTFPKEDFDV